MFDWIICVDYRSIPPSCTMQERGDISICLIVNILYTCHAPPMTAGFRFFLWILHKICTTHTWRKLVANPASTTFFFSIPEYRRMRAFWIYTESHVAYKCYSDEIHECSLEGSKLLADPEWIFLAKCDITCSLYNYRHRSLRSLGKVHPFLPR